MEKLNKANRGQERVLGRKLAREITHAELALISSGHVPGPGETCCGSDCDVELN